MTVYTLCLYANTLKIHDMYPYIHYAHRVPLSTPCAPALPRHTVISLQVERIGPSHQAGSDSLLTAATFFKLKSIYFRCEHTARFCSVVHFHASSILTCSFLVSLPSCLLVCSLLLSLVHAMAINSHELTISGRTLALVPREYSMVWVKVCHQTTLARMWRPLHMEHHLTTWVPADNSLLS